MDEDTLKDDILDTLDGLKDTPDVPDKPEPPKQPAAREIAAEANKKSDEAQAVAWEMVEDHISDTCPDLDDEMRSLIKSASTGPRDYKVKAKAMQAKFAAKKPDQAPDSTADKDLKDKVAEQIFGAAGPGGQKQIVTAPSFGEKRVQEAVKVGDLSGILKGLAEEIESKKMFPGVRLGS